jgi:hypothetical protein
LQGISGIGAAKLGKYGADALRVSAAGPSSTDGDSR